MIHTVIRWLRWTLPPTWIVLLAISVPLLIEALQLWLRWRFGVLFVERGQDSLLEARDGCVAIAMAAFGVFRAAAFHPLFRPKYRSWLDQTPWTSRKPLPVSPICLAWQDVVVVGIVLLALHGTPLGRVWALWAFLFAYLGTLGVSFWLTGPWWMSYLALFNLVVAVRLAPWPLVSLGALIVVYPLVFVGQGMALQRFPWQEELQIMGILRKQCASNSMERRKSLLGWPNGQLTGVLPDGRIRRRDGILMPLLAAACLCALTSNITDPEGRTVLPAVAFAYGSVFAIIGRVVAYVIPCRPPISLWGRILTGRWIIPGYDYVFLSAAGRVANGADWCEGGLSRRARLLHDLLSLGACRSADRRLQRGPAAGNVVPDRPPPHRSAEYQGSPSCEVVAP